jgi:hypothetical protein
VHYTISRTFIGILGIIVLYIAKYISYKIEDLPVATTAYNNVYFGDSSHVKHDSQSSLREVEKGS